MGKIIARYDLGTLTRKHLSKLWKNKSKEMSKTNAECVANQNLSIWSDFAMRNLTDLTEKFRVAFYSTKIHISTNLLNNGLCDTAMKCTEICVQITSQQEWKDSTFLLRFAYRFSSWTDGIVTMLCSIRCLFRISFVHLLKFSWLWFSLALFFLLHYVLSVFENLR